jgi:hypothetical protein
VIGRRWGRSCSVLGKWATMATHEMKKIVAQVVTSLVE